MVIALLWKRAERDGDTQPGGEKDPGRPHCSLSVPNACKNKIKKYLMLSVPKACKKKLEEESLLG